MSILPLKQHIYDDGRTEQCHKDACDINKIIARHARAGTLSHLEQYGKQYGDLAGFDFFEAQKQMAKAKTIFHELPGELRREFGNDPSRFFEYVNDPKNVDDLAQLLPSLAKPGMQMPQPNKGAVNVPPKADQRGATADNTIASPASDSAAVSADSGASQATSDNKTE